ncbi:helix-turn-helix transcriptional regulator [Pelagibius marinus]|uniref:helix-turn-helix transcriptional regulator n=1 Tax=Pelagibius marinus TaxID=2762760 RepID=UPI001872EA08|nr:AraC family transcriptional regulator [Pelagibius marinus]
MGIDKFNQWLLESDGEGKTVAVAQVAQLKDDNWDAAIEKLEVSDGVRLYLTTAKVHRDVTVTPRADVSGWLGSHFTVEGELTLKLPGNPAPEIDIDPQHGVAFRAIDDWAEFRLPEGQTIRHIAWSADWIVMARLLGGDIPEELGRLFGAAADTTPHWPLRTTTLLRKLGWRLFRSPLTGPLRRLETEGALLEIAAHHIGQMVRRSPREDDGTDSRLSRHERQRLTRARHRLIADMRQPPSLSEIATEAGMGERRLNAGFRELFGMTAFEMLRNERLEHARQVLETEDIPLKVVAHRVGYRHVTNFINAFTQRYGTPPKRYLRELADGQETTAAEDGGHLEAADRSRSPEQ